MFRLSITILHKRGELEKERKTDLKRRQKVLEKELRFATYRPPADWQGFHHAAAEAQDISCNSATYSMDRDLQRAH